MSPTVDVAVVHLGGELHLRRLERVVLRELDLQREDTPLIRTAGLQGAPRKEDLVR